MKTISGIFVLAVSLVAGVAMAQDGGAAQQPALTLEQQEMIKRQDADMVQAALQVVRLMDAGAANEIWAGFSAVVKPLVPREEFVRNIGNDRAQLGAVQSRGDAVVNRVELGEGADAPAGLYINIAFPSRFANVEQPIRELVSFRLDEDQVWRVSGYTLR